MSRASTHASHITGGKAGMNTARKGVLRGRPYISVEVRIFPEDDPRDIAGWTYAIDQAVSDVIDACANTMLPEESK